jgi:hypothetical protein
VKHLVDLTDAQALLVLGALHRVAAAPRPR